MSSSRFSHYTDSTPSDQALEEERILQKWKDRDIFNKTLNRESPLGEFVFYEGPPTANGRPGIHHIEARSFKDIIPRYKSMQGYRVMRKAGWDTHGLPVELQVEKKLGLATKKQIEEYGIAEFNKECKESVWEYKSEWEAITERMGYWIDMDNPYVTYHNTYIESCWNVFKKADTDNLVYRGFRVVPWCPRCGTPLSSHELSQPGAYKDVKDLSVIARFMIVSGQSIAGNEIPENTSLLAWTTTPWTLPGNVALAVGSDIEYVLVKHLDNSHSIVAKARIEVLGEDAEIVFGFNGSHLVGIRYQALYPYTANLANASESAKMDKAYQVYTASFVTTEDGTGIVHTAVMYGADDYELGKEIGLPQVHVIDEEGKYLPGCDQFSGRFVKEKNEKGEETIAIDIIKDLAGRGLLFKKEKYEHSYPHCWRCDTPLVYYARDSWYISMSRLRDQLVAGNEHIHWEPEYIKEGRFGDWLSNIKDWSISRNRYWGTPLPIWESSDKSDFITIGSLEELRKHTKKSGNTYYGIRHGQSESNIENIWNMDAELEYNLTETGKEQIAEELPALREKGITKIICSPFVRTRQTAELIARELGIDESEIVIDERLGEYDIGDMFEGERVAHTDRWNKMADPYRDSADTGESLQNLFTRSGEVIYELEKSYSNETILIVSHMSTLIALRYHSENLYDNPFDYYTNADKHIVPHATLLELPFVPMPHNEHYEIDVHRPYIDECIMTKDGIEYTRVPEVMDVWFDSGCMPYAQSHYPFTQSESEFRVQFPADYISEAIDQTRGWFYTMHAVANILGHSHAYNNVVCLGLILDAEGKKMSKSKGNVVSPWAMFNEMSADAIRLWMYSVNQPGESKNFDPKTVQELNNKFFRMLDNCISFWELYTDSSNLPDEVFKPSSDNVLDIWITEYLGIVQQQVTQYLDKYKIFEASRLLRDFVLDLSQWYIRRSRDRVKGEMDTDTQLALGTMRYVFFEFAKLIAPFTPFTAERVYERVAGGMESVHLEQWSTPSVSNSEILETMSQIRDIISEALQKRATAGIKVRQPLNSLTLPEAYTTTITEDFQEIIKDELNVKSLYFVGNEIVLDTEVTSDLAWEGDAREIIRTIQGQRKTAGLVPVDEIVIVVSHFPDELEIHRDMILSITGATSIEIGESDTEITLSNGETLALGIQ